MTTAVNTEITRQVYSLATHYQRLERVRDYQTHYQRLERVREYNYRLGGYVT